MFFLSVFSCDIFCHAFKWVQSCVGIKLSSPGSVGLNINTFLKSEVNLLLKTICTWFLFGVDFMRELKLR